MIKFLQKKLIAAAMIAASFTVRAQVVTENFQSWLQAGFETYTSCEVSTFAVGSFNVTKSYPEGTVIYSLVNTAVNPDATCNYKSGGTNATCTANSTTSGGYVFINKEGGSFTTSKFASITTAEFRLSFTGSYRQAKVQKSTDDGASWTDVGISTGSNCSQYGETFIFTIDESNVMLRVVPVEGNHPTNPANNVPQHIRIHDLVISGSIVAGIKNASWPESGVTVAQESNRLIFNSENTSGSIEIINVAGSVVAQQGIEKGGQSQFVLPSKGLYVARLTSGNKVYTRKIAVQ